MPKQKSSLSYKDIEKGIHGLCLEDQLKLTEIIFANLKEMLSRRTDTEQDQDDDLSRFCGKWQDDRDAEEIVSQIYADRAKNIRSEKAAL
jgi:hypothetical protein